MLKGYLTDATYTLEGHLYEATNLKCRTARRVHYFPLLPYLSHDSLYPYPVRILTRGVHYFPLLPYRARH